MSKRQRAAAKKKINNMLFRMAKLELQPSDTIVLQTDLMLDKNQITALRARANEQFKPYRVAILTAGLKLGVLRKVKR
jgi:hypothetical protein